MTLPLTGTASVTTGSATVVVSGFALSRLTVIAGTTVYIAKVPYFVLSVTDTTTLELEEPYAGATNAAAPIKVNQIDAAKAATVTLNSAIATYSARLALLDADGKGLFYTSLGVTGANDPGPGKLARNAAAWDETTEVYIDVIDAAGRTVAGLIDLATASATMIVLSLATGGYAAFNLTAAPTNQGPDQWRKLAGLAFVGGSGAVADGEDVAILFKINGEGLHIDAVGPLAGRAAHDAAAAKFVYLSDDGDGALIISGALFVKKSATAGDWSVGVPFRGIQGYRGWAPKFTGATDGARKVWQLMGYAGGEGPEPTTDVGKYLGAAGMVTALADAFDFRGIQGLPGTNGIDGASMLCRVRTVATVNVNLAAPGASIDGIAMAANDVFLATAETSGADNGLYVWNGAAVAASRVPAFSTFAAHPGIYVSVMEGTAKADTLWRCTANLGGTLGVTALTFAEVSVTVTDDSITNAKLANMATTTIKGRATAGAGDPEDLTVTQVLSLLGLTGLDMSVSLLALQVADNTNVALFLGSSGNRVADSFDASTYVDVAGATNLDSSVAGLLKPTASWSGATFLMHADGANGSTSFPDAIGSAVMTAFNGANVTTSFQKFGTGSALFPSTSYLLADGSAGFTFGTGDFTIDFWIRPGTIAAQYLYDGRTASSQIVPLIRMTSAGGLDYFVNGAVVITGATTMTAGTWYHVALARSSGVTKMFLNGVQQGASYTDANNYIGNANRPAICTVGDAPGNTAGFTGCLDELRVCKGTALWAANFTPPAAAMASIANSLTVRSASFVAATTPTKMKAVLRVKEVDAAVAGTDYTLECSRDGGTTWAATTLTELFTSLSPVAGVRVVEAAETDVSGQPSGTAPRWRFKTLNTKNVELHDVYFYWS